MRWLFIVLNILLLQLFTYGIGRVLQWWLSEWFEQKKLRLVLWGMFIFGNSLLILAILRISKINMQLFMMWMSLLWLLTMSIIVAILITFLIKLCWQKLYQSPKFTLWGIRGLMLISFLSLLTLGIYNAYTPTVRHITLTSKQTLAQPLRIGLASDLHLGWLFGNRQLDLLTTLVQQEKIELLLMPGDIMDDDTHEYYTQNMQPHLQNLVNSVPLGVYATLGNHDLFGHEEEISQALQQAGVNVLIDDNLLVDNRIWLVGRLDDLAKYRKPTQEILPNSVDKPIILLDHRPSDVDNNVKLPIDLQVSGHTHNGQIFPANFLVKMLNTVAYGHQKIHDTHVLVTSGYGFWGVPIRLGSQSEIWVIDFK